jgi:hypothetical protein
MSLLSPSEMAEMSAFAQGQEPEQQAEVEQQAEQTQQQAPDPKQGQDAQEEPQAQQQEAPSAPAEQRKHTVPYERLQQTIRERNEARAQMQQMQQTVAQLQSQLQQKSAVAAQVRAELEREGLVDPSTGEVEDATDPRVRQLVGTIQQQQQVLEQLQVAHAQQELNAELSDLAVRFPMVPKQYLLKATVADANVNLEEVAHEYMSWISPHIQQAPKPTAQAAPPPARVQTPSAPPRPAKAGAVSSPSAGGSEQKGWGDRKSRTNEVAAMLGEMGWK